MVTELFKKIIFIQNSRSGSYAVFKKNYPVICEHLQSISLDLSFERVDLFDDLEAMLSRHDSEDTVFIACGGDGTVSLLSNLIFKKKYLGALGVFPLGTGNDFARSVGVLPLIENLHAYCQLITNKRSRRSLDIWAFGGNTFVNYLSLGFDGRVVNLFDRLRNRLPAFLNKKKLNLLYYALCGLYVLFFGKRMRGELDKKDSAPLNLKVFSLIFSNIDSYSGGLHHFELSKLDDREINIKVMTSKYEVLRFNLFEKRSKTQGVASVCLKLDDCFWYQVDGEAKKGEPGVYEVNWLGTIQFVGAC